MRTEPMAEAVVAPAPALWLVDKAAGPTSHDVVATARRALGKRAKVGHSGTLDPFATGLLVLMVGRATRLAPYLTGVDKTYVATVQTGQVSATLDPEGPIEESGPPASAADVEAILPSFVGVQLQRVPALSAVHVDGERLYQRARRGEEVELPEREVVVHSLRLVGDEGQGRVVVEVRCGAGTYVRRLAADIGERLGCGAYCAELRRTRVGELAVEDAVPVGQVAATGGLDPLRGLGHLPARELSEEEAGRVRHGGRIAYAAAAGGVEAVTLLREGRLMAIAVPDADGGLRPSVVLEDAP